MNPFEAQYSMNNQDTQQDAYYRQRQQQDENYRQQQQQDDYYRQQQQEQQDDYRQQQQQMQLKHRVLGKPKKSKGDGKKGHGFFSDLFGILKPQKVCLAC